jgi:cation diffusion facilitator family transporter
MGSDGSDHGRAQQVSRRSAERTQGSAGESRKTVLIALAANAAIAVAKGAAGLVSGSTALLAEAAHSIADTTNQAFLLVSIRLGRREPDSEQPFGYGQERFLWAFMAAIGMFLAGAIFAIGYGSYEIIKDPEEGGGGFLPAYIALGIAAAAEGTSWLRALRQTRGEAQESGKPLLEHVRGSRDPNVKMVLFEDSAALVGVAIALVGIVLHQLTGSPMWDRGASILIGVMLIGVAWFMGRDARHLLIGSAAREDERREIERTIERFDEVDHVVELLTMVLGPNALLVAARIDLADGLDAERIESVSDEIDRAVREAVPDVTEVFLDATPGESARFSRRRAAARPAAGRAAS